MSLRPRRRLHRSAFIIVAAGTLTGLAAADGAGPFGDLAGHHLPGLAAAPGLQVVPSFMPADQLFPSRSAPAPTESVLTIQDAPPPPRIIVLPGAPTPAVPPTSALQPAGTAAPATAQPARPSGTSSAPAPTPSAPPPCDDNCGSGDG